MSLAVEFPITITWPATRGASNVPTRNACHHYRTTKVVGDTYFVNIYVRVVFVKWSFKLPGHGKVT